MLRRTMLLLIIIVLAAQSQAGRKVTGFGPENPLIVPPAGTPTTIAQCIASAARTYDVSEALLYTIGMVESNMNPEALNYNKKSSTEDIGLMQINSRWLDSLARRGVEREDLFDPCVSIHVGAWVLRGNMILYGRTWRAVGAYNASSRRPDLREKYVFRIKSAMRKFGLLEVDS